MITATDIATQIPLNAARLAADWDVRDRWDVATAASLRSVVAWVASQDCVAVKSPGTDSDRTVVIEHTLEALDWDYREGLITDESGDPNVTLFLLKG